LFVASVAASTVVTVTLLNRQADLTRQCTSLWSQVTYIETQTGLHVYVPGPGYRRC
jgi:hypothetical protein